MEFVLRRVFLVGLMLNIKLIEGDDCYKIVELLGIFFMEVLVVVFFIKRCFK